MKVDLKYDEVLSIIESDAKEKKLLRDKLKQSIDNIERNKTNLRLTKLNGRLQIWTKLFPKITHKFDCEVFINKDRKCEDCGIDFRWGYYSESNLTEQFEKPKRMKEFEESDFLVSVDGGNEFSYLEDEIELGNFDEIKLCEKCIKYLKSQRQDKILKRIKELEEGVSK